jgi:hypothetical protein
MLISDLDLQDRIKSPDNLINSMRERLSGIRSIVKPQDIEPKEDKVIIPEIVEESVPAIDDLIENSADKIKLGLAKTSAADVLVDSLGLLKTKLIEVEKPLDLARIAGDMSKIVGSLSPAKNETNIGQQIIVYRPAVLNESHYESVHVNE